MNKVNRYHTGVVVMVNGRRYSLLNDETVNDKKVKNCTDAELIQYIIDTDGLG